MRERISIVLSSDNNFAQHGAVLIHSIYANTKEPEAIDVYYIDGGISDENKRNIKDSSCGFNENIHFITINEKEFSGLYISQQYSLATYYRLMIADLLPRSVQKCIYLDCDMVICDDIQKLWAIPLDGCILGAVVDVGMVLSKHYSERCLSLELSEEDEYFNAGMLLIDLYEWRKNGIGILALREAQSHKFKSHDQDVLNKILEGNFKKIDPRWNCMPAVTGFSIKLALNCRKYKKHIASRFDMANMHFAGRYKPWEYPESKGFSDLYYKELKQTPYRAYKPVRSPQNENRSNMSEKLRISVGKLIYKTINVLTN